MYLLMKLDLILETENIPQKKMSNIHDQKKFKWSSAYARACYDHEFNKHVEWLFSNTFMIDYFFFWHEHYKCQYITAWRHCMEVNGGQNRYRCSYVKQ